MEDDIKKILDIFESRYPEPKCELSYDTPFQLLIATVMAAQATDKKVNEITAQLFKEYKKPEDFVSLSEEELQDKIKSINYYRTKSRNILSICRTLLEKYNGEVPADLDELVKLAGVGRKTANVVLSNAFNIPAIAVDTHVHRVANRLGLVITKDVESTEQQLANLIPKEYWSRSHNYLVLHGRYVCNAKKPKCEVCELNSYCRYFQNNT